MLADTYRLLAIDVDGTLLGPDHQISPATSAALADAIAGGWVVCVCTGRNYTEARPYLRQLEGRGPGVFVSGAIANDVVSGRTLFRVEMDGPSVREAIALYRDCGCGVLVLCDATDTGWQYAYLPGRRTHPRLEAWLARTPCTVATFTDVPADWRAVLRVGVIGSGEQIRTVHRRIAARFGRRVTHHTIRVPNHDMIVHETFAADANKWNSVRRVAEQMGIDPSQIIAVGDDVNDVPMLRGAGLGVAMGNASPATRRAADLVISPNTEDGLAQFIRLLLAGKALT